MSGVIMNVSIERCANCGLYLDDRDFAVKFNSDEEVCRSVLMGYCCRSEEHTSELQSQR